jgi:hypothetical protein
MAYIYVIAFIKIPEVSAKKMTSRSPQRPAGEPNTAAKGFFSFATKGRLARLKKTGSCHDDDEGAARFVTALRRQEQPPAWTAGQAPGVKFLALPFFDNRSFSEGYKK